jgi:Na+-driven multidrug efflux pump
MVVVVEVKFCLALALPEGLNAAVVVVVLQPLGQAAFDTPPNTAISTTNIAAIVSTITMRFIYAISFRYYIHPTAMKLKLRWVE